MTALRNPLLLVLVLLTCAVFPAFSRVVIGPESGRDRLHRLMHDEGANIGEEDAAAKKDWDRENEAARKGQSAPVDQETYLHGMGMHGDMKKAAYEKQEAEKDKKEENGPCVGMDCLHGVLMHGDEELGDSHERDHQKAAKIAKAREDRDKGKAASVADPHELLHEQHKSIAETSDDVKRYESHRRKGDTGPLKEPIRLEFEPQPEPEGESFFQAFKNFLRRLFVGSEDEEEEESDEEDMDMRHDLEHIGRSGPLPQSKHKHGTKSKRQKRTEHKTEAHHEH